MFGKIAKKIDNILSGNCSVSIPICGDFNIFPTNSGQSSQLELTKKIDTVMTSLSLMI